MFGPVTKPKISGVLYSRCVRVYFFISLPHANLSKASGAFIRDIAGKINATLDLNILHLSVTDAERERERDWLKIRLVGIHTNASISYFKNVLLPRHSGA